MIKVLFITNILSNHQVGLWDPFSTYDDIEFTYLCTRPRNDTADVNRYLAGNRDYVTYSESLSESELSRLIEDETFLVVGSVEDPRVYRIIQKKRNVFICYEHVSKDDYRSMRLFRRLRRKIGFIRYAPSRFSQFDLKTNYLLCASSYVGRDFWWSGMPKRRMLKFGYFPPTNPADCLVLASKDKYSLLYVGRGVDWKHPEIAIDCLNGLRQHDERYHLVAYGSELDKYLPVDNKSVVYGGFVDNKRLRKVMEGTGVFIFPSSRCEGWGAVLGEAMEAGCIVFANVDAGATNFLVNDENGFRYSGRRGLARAIKKYLSMSDEEVMKMRMKAVETMQLWSGNVAAERLMACLKCLAEGNKPPNYKKGPLSKAFLR